MNNAERSQLVTIGEAARRFEISVPKLRRLIQEEAITTYVDGRDLRRRLVRPDDVIAALSPREENAA